MRYVDIAVSSEVHETFKMQKTTNTMVFEVQCITAHSSTGHGAEYYFLHNGTTSFPTSMIRQVHNSLPFTKESMRILNNSDQDVIPITDDVSCDSS